MRDKALWKLRLSRCHECKKYNKLCCSEQGVKKRFLSGFRNKIIGAKTKMSSAWNPKLKPNCKSLKVSIRWCFQTLAVLRAALHSTTQLHILLEGSIWRIESCRVFAWFVFRNSWRAFIFDTPCYCQISEIKRRVGQLMSIIKSLEAC